MIIQRWYNFRYNGYNVVLTTQFVQIVRIRLKKGGHKRTLSMLKNVFSRSDKNNTIMIPVIQVIQPKLQRLTAI